MALGVRRAALAHSVRGRARVFARGGLRCEGLAGLGDRAEAAFCARLRQTRLAVAAPASSRTSSRELEQAPKVSHIGIRGEGQCSGVALGDSFYYFVPTPGAGDISATQQAFLKRSGTPSYGLSNVNFLGAIEASASIPLAFEPVKFNHGTNRNFLYVDGGVANNTPIKLAISAGADDITVVFMDPVVAAPPYQEIPNAAALGMACYTVMQQKLLADDMKLALMTNEAIATGSAAQLGNRAGLAEKSQITLREVRPVHPLNISIPEFNDQEKLSQAFDEGLADASKVHEATLSERT